jgi:AcrR family transcriptional regulator
MRVAAVRRTRERILDGAARAVARHGLVKLGMGDVSQNAAVSRGTLYRYFPNRGELLRTLAAREGRLFQQRVLEAIKRTPAGPERIGVALEHAIQHAREHPVLQRILETDPAFVLRSLREQLPAVRAALHRLLAPLLRQTRPVRDGVVTADQLVDWLTRVMISAFLFPDPEPQAMTRGLIAVYRLLTAPARRHALPHARRLRRR